MQNVYLTSNWFFGLDVLFELAFAVIALAVGIYAFKVYKLTNQNQSRLFGNSFILISISYFIQSFTNFAIISKINENLCNILKIQAVDTLNSIGVYAHIIFFILGLSTLTYMTLNIKSKKTYSLILIVSLFFILMSTNKVYSFYLLSSIFLAYISFHYLLNYFRHRQAKTLLVLIAFTFLLFGSIHFMLAVNHALFYIIGHFLELAAYLLILTNLILILKNGKKTK